MKFRLNIILVPNNKKPRSYFEHKGLSIEAALCKCDSMFKESLLKIPELKKFIINVIDNNGEFELNTNNITDIDIVYDFTEYEEILFYWKLSQPTIFDYLFLNLIQQI